MLAVAPKHFILMEVLTFFGYFMWLMQKSCEDVSLEVKGCESVTCRCWPLTEGGLNSFTVRIECY